MDATSLFPPGSLAIAIAFVVMGIETWLSRPNPLEFIRSLRQPSWAMPFAAFVTVPILFYGIATYAMASALRVGEPGRIAFALVLAVLLGNAILNHFLCRRRRIDWTFRLAIPAAAIAAAAAHAVFAFDRTAGILMGLVTAFCLYDVMWFAALARLNPEHTGGGTTPR